ncbi:hypothetical protein [Thalassospira lucentensis]|uniref:hypothetical protein n=1 Tax=Thalassospira lucentensis TaxID=168935 RepID=UPI003AA89914
MLRKIAGFCKAHFNPLAVMFTGACLGIAAVLPFIPSIGDETFLYRWQSMIGAVISATLAVGLFQFQRYIDRREQRKNLIFAAVRALKRIKSHYENVKINLASATLDRIAINQKIPRTGIAMQNDQKAAANCIAEVIMLYGKYTDILNTVPRDQDLGSDIIIEIDEIDESIEKTSHAIRMLLDQIGNPTNWDERDEKRVPRPVVDAQRLLEDIANQRTQIDKTLCNFQRKLSSLTERVIKLE